MAITTFGNMAIKVGDLDAALRFFQQAGAPTSRPSDWHGGRRADVVLGSVGLTIFTRAVYEDFIQLPDEGFLHVAVFTDDLDAQLQGHEIVWGPAVVSGTFGIRRVAFVTAPGGIRLEFMEQLEGPSP